MKLDALALWQQVLREFVPFGEYRMRMFIVAASTLALSACNIAAEEDFVEDPRLQQGATLFNDLANRPRTSVAEMPVSGSARYTGFARVFTLIDGENGFAVGDAVLTSSFGPGPSGTFTGTVSNLVDDGSERIPGTILVSGTSNAASMSGTVGGDVTVAGETLNVAGTLTEGRYTGSAATSFFTRTTGTLSDGARTRGTFEGSIFGQQ